MSAQERKLFSIGAEGRRQHVRSPAVSIADARGRSIVAIVTTWTATHQQLPTASTSGFLEDTRVNGWTTSRPYAANVQTGRDGASYGAAQRTHYFSTETDRLKWIDAQVSRMFNRYERNTP